MLNILHKKTLSIIVQKNHTHYSKYFQQQTEQNTIQILMFWFYVFRFYRQTNWFHILRSQKAFLEICHIPTSYLSVHIHNTLSLTQETQKKLYF